MWKKYSFANSNLPARFRNAITAELNMFHYGHHSVLSCYGHEMSAPIPDWLILAWIEDKTILKVPNIGKGSINQALETIVSRHTIEKQIVLRPEQLGAKSCQKLSEIVGMPGFLVQTILFGGTLFRADKRGELELCTINSNILTALGLIPIASDDWCNIISRLIAPKV